MLIRTDKARPPISEFWRPIVALIIRELNTTHGRYPAGYIWLFLEPIGAILLISAVFSFFLRSPSLGDNFPIYFALGYLPYSMYTEVQSRVMGSIGFSKGLLRYPRVTIIDAIIARVILSVITVWIYSIVIIYSLCYFYDFSVTIDYSVLISAFLLAGTFGLSVGCINCYMITRHKFWPPVWAIMKRPTFILSGVLYIYEDVPAKIQNVVWYNPLLHTTGMARSAVFPGYEPTYLSAPYVLGVSLVLLFLGLVLLSVLSRDYVEGQ